MVAAILGQKIGMTRVFDDAGASVPVTVVQAGPCPILQVKTGESDGYEAVQLGFVNAKPSRTTRAEIGHAKKANTVPQKFVREIRLMNPTDKAVGESVTVALFEEQNIKFVDVVGTSIGKGFQGVMKRHHFAGQGASHGTERKHRSPGAIGGQGNIINPQFRNGPDLPRKIRQPGTVITAPADRTIIGSVTIIRQRNFPAGSWPTNGRT